MKKASLIFITVLAISCNQEKKQQETIDSGQVSENRQEEVAQIPTPVSPENNATVHEEKPLFEWSEIPGDQLYQVEIHQYEDLMAPAWSDYPKENTWRIEEKFMGLDDGETYYWRVKKGNSEWSEVYKFTVELKD